MTQPNIQQPQHFRSLDGTRYQLGPMQLVCKRHQDDAEPQADVAAPYSLFESLEPPGASVALHRHPAWQETFVVLEGRFDFKVEDKHFSLGPGETLMIPRGAAHGFACTSPQPGRLLTISTPPRVFESFVADISAANADPSSDIPAVFARHGLELL